MALESWSEIEGIENAVGVGTYTTHVTAGRRLATGRRGARPREPWAGPTASTSTGGRSPSADQLGTLVDLGGRLKEGRNVVQVKVASTLLNRLRVHRPAEFGSRTPTINGLLGPVTLDPYKVVGD